MVALVRDSGYLRSPNTVNEESLERFFSENPDAVDAWLLESMDQRFAPAWYFMEPSGSSHEWIVGYLTAQGQRTRETLHRDGAKACAFFVRRWLDLIERIANDG